MKSKRKKISKVDPVCGMAGHIPKYSHYFCSQQCIEKYEDQKNIKKKWYKTKGFKTFLYLVVIAALIALVTVLQITGFMLWFMGGFFVIVSFLKFIDWKGFAKRFAMYDILAKRSRFYAYIYPIIELAIGISFLLKWNVTNAAVVLFVIMVGGAVGVGRNLLSKNPVKCACLGVKIKVPLTKFTLFEDITMAVMALMILL